MQEVAVNYWAVLVCGIASMVLGSIWYGPLFGKMFIELVGMNHMDPAKKAEMMKKMNLNYGLAFIGALVMAYALAHSLVFAQAYMKVSGTATAFQGAFWTWLGFMVPVILASVLWEGKAWKLFVLNSSYYLVQLLIFALILVNWK